MRLTDFWPATDEDHMSCLITEAETAAEEVFLSVHQPMKLTRSYFGANSEPVPQTEEDVLDALLVKRPPSGTLILPIVGDSGVGKSHMIRWLDARLKLLPDHKRRHIVRIPRSSSLKEVLRLILKELPGTKYDKLRHKLDEARIPEDRLEATRTLQTKLLVALEVAGKEATARIKQNIAQPDDPALAAHCSERALIALLLDPEIARHFIFHEGDDEGKWGVLTRIAERCLRGSKRIGSSPAETEFRPKDFAFISESAELDLSILSKSARSYIPTLRRGPKVLADVIRFLNGVLEAARSGLVDLRGVSLTELFIDIRRNLLEDHMELVLLVEDFAVLAGIQGPLLDAMIYRGIDGTGRQELCIMRTALAVTEGRLSDETVRTRAPGRWKIDSEPFATEEEAIATFENFVGGYLNAARWGVSGLKIMFATREDRTDSANWVRCFFEKHQDDMEDTEKKQLLAFGVCSRGKHPLFPFNRGAIRQLARQYFYHRPTDSYRFDPRTLIKRLLIATIENNRTAWEDSAFPSQEFSDFRSNLLNPDVYLYIRSALGEQDTRRAAPLVYFWGDDPKSPGEAATLPDEIHDAFHIPRIKWGARPTPPEPSQPAPSPGPVPAPPKDRTDTWAKILDGWRINGVLGQTDANKVRTYLSEAVAAWLDTNALLLSEVKNIPNIYLPKAKGNPEREKATVTAATDEEFDDEVAGPRFITAIQAVVRYHERKTWDYEGGETDYARYANFIAKLSTQAEKHFLAKGSLMTREGIKPVAQALLIGARILNIEGASANTDAENLSAMLAEAAGEPPPTIDSPTPWQRLKSGAHRSRAELRTALLSLISARQGTGDKIHALDSTPLLDAISELRAKKWVLEEDPAAHLTLPSQGVKEHLRQMRNLTPVTQRADEVITWAAKVKDSFGADFDPSDLVANMRAAVMESRDAGVFRCRFKQPPDFLPRLKDVTSLGTVRDHLTKAEKLRDNRDKFDIVLSTVAQVDDALMVRMAVLIDDYQLFLKETEATVADKLKDVPLDLDDTTSRLRAELELLATHWESMIDQP